MCSVVNKIKKDINMVVNKSVRSMIIFVFLVLLVNASPVIANDNQPTFKDSLDISDSTISYSTQGSCPRITCIGTIQNRSGKNWGDIVVEVKFYNAAGELIDTITEHDYDQIVSAGDEVTFRVDRSADKSSDQYVKHTARITWADEIINYKRNKKNSPWFEIIISWMPMIILIAVWIFFMRKMAHKNSPQKQSVDALQKQIELVAIQNDLLERLVVAVETNYKKTDE